MWTCSAHFNLKNEAAMTPNRLRLLWSYTYSRMRSTLFYLHIPMPQCQHIKLYLPLLRATRRGIRIIINFRFTPSSSLTANSTRSFFGPWRTLPIASIQNLALITFFSAVSHKTVDGFCNCTSAYSNLSSSSLSFLLQMVCLLGWLKYSVWVYPGSNHLLALRWF